MATHLPQAGPFEVEIVRKLLVASQKAGVGKTTTSINLAAAAARGGGRVLVLDADPLSSVSNALNLAAYPQRQLLREHSLDLPGVFCRDVAPGVDVLSPYEGGSCDDEDLTRLLELFDAAPFRESYACVIVDAPPFLGANPGQLLAAADEFVLVMRAEALAHRTLPAFQELVLRARKGLKPVPLKGILLTLPEGESPGGRAEREMRGRLGTRILPTVIPYDAEVGSITLLGQVASVVQPESTAVQAYAAIAIALGLTAAEVPAGARSGEVGLIAAARQAQLLSRQQLSGDVTADRDGASVLVMESGFTPDDPLPLQPIKPKSRVVPVLPPVGENAPLPKARLRPRAKPTIHSLELPPITARETGPSVPAVPAAPPAAPPAAAAPPPAPALQPWWIVWTALGVLGGIGLRFVQLPTSALPIAVGIAVAACTVLVLKLFMVTPEEPASRPAQATRSNGHAPAPRAESRSTVRTAPTDSSKRLSALAQRAASARRHPDGH